MEAIYFLLFQVLDSAPIQATGPGGKTPPPTKD